ncbi:MAG: hypothetical protein PHQ66_02310 [Candidatus Nanoarchaeia archaeon]|nr:hypothetical protein [Candidatus Nanoarchaeia archaeon]MDD5357797.1 hypothetical protein [Candidatus Nanoarchaeia archaeon]MDD5588716.1 hypothetical protein [Candidatus Nanoarchaeia archaeon]
MAEVKSISQIIEEISPYHKKKKGPESTHLLVYDSSSETLEPIYFFILDLMNDFGLKPEKLVDNFSSTPGSGHFAELGQRATIMQQQATKMMGDVNVVLRSVLNIIYDLKEFKMRLLSYDGLKSKKSEEKDAAVMSLKQIWMDKVDIAKGNSSIKAMALGQAGFQTLLDAFLIAQNEKDVDKMDLNDRVKRILKPRVQEFNIWLSESEKELKKRYELEKTYLRSQVNSLKLYSRWVKPYLKAATDLESKESGREPALVKTFNTIMLELTLLGKNKFDIADEALKGNLPADFAKEKFLKGIKRNYYSCILVDFSFRGIPQRVSQQAHFAFGGRAEVTFKSYVLNDDELKKFEEQMKKSEISDVFSLIEGTTTASLGQLEEEINSFLEEKSEEKEKPKDESNPIFALLGMYEKPEKKKEEKSDGKPKEIVVAPDSWIEENYFRKLAAEAAKDKAFSLFDVYKGAHGMSSYT